MILTGKRIEVAHRDRELTIEPFESSQLNPNSYDFRLGSTLLTYCDMMLDAAHENPTDSHEITPEGFELSPDRIYLGHTLEIMGSSKFVPIIRAKSSIARLGLFVHVTADLIDIGSVNQWTLQLHAVQPVKVYPGMLIGQVTFWVPEGEISLYDGKYQGSQGPRASESFRDFPL